MNEYHSKRPFGRNGVGRLSCIVGLTLGAGVACGVVEHPHDTTPIDTSCDFGCPGQGSGGQSVLTAGGTSSIASGGFSNGNGGTTSAGTTGAPSFGGVGSVSGGATSTAVGSGGSLTSGGNGTIPSSGGAVSSGGTTAVGSGGATVTGSITLGGTVVPADHAIGFIHIGHSNMAGRATVPTASRPYHFQQTDPHAWMYHPGSQPQLAIEPKTAGDTAAGGPGTALVKQAAALAPNYYFISLGWAQPSAYCSQFLPGALYYDQLIAGPKAIKGHITFGAIFIFLGITERHGSDDDRNGFSQCINQLVTAIRTDVGVPDLPAMMNDYEVEATGELAVGSPEYNAIKPQIDMCPKVVSNFSLVPCDGLGMQDDHHFNLDGHFTWVQRAMTTMQQKGWFKWK